MSIELITELYNRRSINPKLQRVLLCLCDAANDSGVCWPSIGRIAWKLECNESTVQRAIRELKEIGVVTVSTRGGHSNMYHVDLGKLPEKSPFQPPIQTPLQNATPPQSVPHGGMQSVPHGGMQNATHNRKENRKENRNLDSANLGDKTRASNLSPEEAEIFDVYCQENGVDKAANFGRVRKEVKAIIAEAGSDADEVRRCMKWMRRDPFWQGKAIQIISVQNKLDEFRANDSAAKPPARREDYMQSEAHKASMKGWDDMLDNMIAQSNAARGDDDE